ncbi:MAG: DNA polymerase-3 subunit delta' [Woeseiaceae bacterium]|jgi:DNA polymerase-3 subunit delta'
MKLSWHKNLESSWLRSVDQGRAPHAVLLLGVAGSGKRCAAAWLARTHLGLAGAEAGVQYPLQAVEHADMRWISPVEDKHTIGIEQIRELVSALALTSYEGRGKVAVIDPAHAMTANAANSLLKTLEEPPGNALLILVADRVGRLPATIFSRCQRLSIALPSEEDGMRWLEQMRPGEQWGGLLREAGNAPLAAVVAAGQRQDTEILSRDFAALASKKGAPLEVAARWSKYEPEFVLKWLSRQVQNCIQRTFDGVSSQHNLEVSQSVLQCIDRRNLFCYLDTVNGLRGQPVGSFNVLLTLESLLIDWAGGLSSHQGLAPAAHIQPLWD